MMAMMIFLDDHKESCRKDVSHDEQFTKFSQFILLVCNPDIYINATFWVCIKEVRY